MVGWSVREGFFHCRFRSTPLSEHRLFPKTTPSGLSTGTTLKTKSDRKIRAAWASEAKKSIKPFIIHEAGVSPGCTRPEMTMHFFKRPLRRSAPSSVMVRTSTSCPPMVWHSVDRATCRRAYGRLRMSVRCALWSEKVYLREGRRGE